MESKELLFSELREFPDKFSRYIKAIEASKGGNERGRLYMALRGCINDFRSSADYLEKKYGFILEE